MSLTFYSQKIDKSLAETVQRIAGKHDRFSTDIMSDPRHDTHIGDTWLEAWEDQQTRRWYIDRYTGVSGDIFHKEKVSALGVCFFDALEYCASFVSLEEDKKKIPLPHYDTDTEHRISYREAAAAAGQIFDENGQLHPCAHGRILTDDGYFSGETLVAARTGKVELTDKPRAPIATDLLDAIAESATGKEKNNFPKKKKKKDLSYEECEEIIRNTISAGNGMITSLKDCIRYNFYKSSMGYFPSTDIPESSDTSPILRSMDLLHLRRYAPPRGFNEALQGFHQATSALSEHFPEIVENLLLNDFARAAETACYMEMAAAFYKNCKEQGSPDTKIAKGLPYVERAGKIAGFSDADTDLMKTAYLRGDINPYTFLQKIRKRWKEDKSEYHSDGIRSRLKYINIQNLTL